MSIATQQQQDGKFVIIANGEVVKNAKGITRTFARERDARRAAELIETPAVDVTPEEPKQAGALSDRALLVKLETSAWQGTKVDDVVSAKTAHDHGAAADAGRYTKRLVQSDAHGRIKSLVTMTRKAHTELSLPWSDSRILPIDQYENYMSVMGDYQAKFEKTVREFLGEYMDAMEMARSTLGEMFNESDYPEIDELEEKFRFEISVSPVPDGNDFRANVSEAQASQIRKSIEKDVNRRAEEAAKDGIRQIAELLKDFVHYVGEKDGKRFTKAQIRKAVREFERVAQNDITEARDIQKFAALAKEAVSLHDAFDIRASAASRDEVTTKANEVLEKMAGFV